MSGAFCGGWVGVASVQQAAPWSGTKGRSGSGSRSAGRKLKKSPKRAAHDRFHRRKWIERAPTPLPHLGAERADAGAAISFQLEDTVGDGRGDVVELLLPIVCGRHPQSTDHPVPFASAASYPWQVADRQGRTAGPSQRRGVGFCAPTAGTPLARVPAGVRAGIKPGRVSVGALEATRVAQLLSAELRTAQRSRSPRSMPHAPSAHSGLRLLATGGTLSVVSILCEPQ
jgi:gas vesicle protein